jgi:hypothetical protein
MPCLRRGTAYDKDCDEESSIQFCAGLTLPGAEAAHKVFSDQNWQIVIDFEE